jgi:hypothetical protein
MGLKILGRSLLNHYGNVKKKQYLGRFLCAMKNTSFRRKKRPGAAFGPTPGKKT